MFAIVGRLSREMRILLQMLLEVRSQTLECLGEEGCYYICRSAGSCAGPLHTLDYTNKSRGLQEETVSDSSKRKGMAMGEVVDDIP